MPNRGAAAIKKPPRFPGAALTGLKVESDGFGGLVLVLKDQLVAFQVDVHLAPIL